MKLVYLLSFLCLFTSRLGAAVPESIEGVWQLDSDSNLSSPEISFCKNVASRYLPIKRDQIIYADFPYREIGGNSAEILIEYQLLNDQYYVEKINLTDSGLVPANWTCDADPEACRSTSLAIFDVFADQNPNVDFEILYEVIGLIDYRSLERTPNSYRFVRTCEEQQQKETVPLEKLPYTE